MSDKDLILTRKSREGNTVVIFENDSKYVQNIFASLLKHVFIIGGSLINSIARCLIFNVIFLFTVRDRVKGAWDNVLNIQLSIIEVIVFGNIFLFRLLCKITGTRIKKYDDSDDKYNDKYDNRGYLRYGEIHRQYWSHRDITYKDEENAYSVSTNLRPITKFLDITRNETVPGNDLRCDHSFEPHADSEKVENVLSTADGEVHRKYFSFYRKQKKLGDSQSLTSKT